MIFHFADILGQEKAKDMLLRSANRGRMGHAFLFKGPAGVGKKTLGHTFAAYINCHGPQDDEPCGACPSCRKFRSGNHPDFMAIEPEGAAIKISQVRELKKALAFPPFEARFRTVLLTDIHTMRREAANSLLKTLEEPPEGNILILTGDEASEILPTIISRCQVIPFFPLPYEQVAQALMADGEISEADAATLAAVSEGSLGRAKLLQKKGLLAFRREIIEALLSLAPGTPTAIQAVSELAENAAKLKEDLSELFELIKTWLHDLILQQSGVADKAINSDLFNTFTGGSRWSPEQITARLRQINTAQRQLARNCNPAAVCEVLFFALL